MRPGKPGGRPIYSDSLLESEDRSVMYVGRLALKYEAAGKVRVFAMADCITQWVLKPLHKWIFRILGRYPDVDGTFNQYGPLSRVPFGQKPIYSFDLSAATDRLPVSLQEKLLSSVFGIKFASLWRRLLVGRKYFLYHERKIHEFEYSVGQPMGALSSWGMLALTHHFIVQVSAWRAGHSMKQLFTAYAVLGDDIIIWDEPTSRQYLHIMKSIGVEVGLAKSVISLAGTSLEFAKKTFFKSKDVSPCSLQEYSAALSKASAFLEYTRKYKLDDGQIRRLLGVGYRSHNSKRWTLFQVLRNHPQGFKDIPSLFQLGDSLSATDRMRDYERWLYISGIFKRHHAALLSRVTRLYYLYNRELVGIQLGPVIPSFQDSVNTVIRRELITEKAQFEIQQLQTFASLLRGIVIEWDELLAHANLRNSVRTAISSISMYKMDPVNSSPNLSFVEINSKTKVKLLNLINDYYSIEERVSLFQANQLLSPVYSVSEKRGSRERRRLEEIWTTWSKVVMTTSLDRLSN